MHIIFVPVEMLSPSHAETPSLRNLKSREGLS